MAASESTILTTDVAHSPHVLYTAAPHVPTLYSPNRLLQIEEYG